jgi:hypothetical protein
LRKRALFYFASQNPTSSGDTHTAFAVEAFLDEIAVEAYFRRHCRKRLNADSGTPLMRKTGRWRIAPVKHVNGGVISGHRGGEISGHLC